MSGDEQAKGKGRAGDPALAATDDHAAHAVTGVSDGAPLASPGAVPHLIADRYRMGRRIGRGGFGAVYEAVDQRLDKKVAVKILDEERAGTEGGVKQFRAEALAASRLRHPGIIAVTDYDLLPDGRPFLVMEFATGETLEAMLARRGALPPDVAARIARDIAGALVVAHQSGVVHRDLKPANVMVEEGAPVPVKILDFGIARIVDAGKSTRVTDAGALIGTPHYMAPEQIRQSHGSIGPHTDVYALGAVLYEMLSGQPPFARITGVAELLLAHLSDPVPPLTAGVPAALVAATGRALEKDPARRFSSAQSFADALTTGTAPAASSAPSLPAPRPASSRRLVAGVAAAVVAGAAVALGFVLTRGGSSPKAPAAAPAGVVSDAAPVAPASTPDAAMVVPAAIVRDAGPPDAGVSVPVKDRKRPKRGGGGEGQMPDAPKENFKVPK